MASGLGPKHQAKPRLGRSPHSPPLALSGSHKLSVKKINKYICLSLSIYAYIYIHTYLHGKGHGWATAGPHLGLGPPRPGSAALSAPGAGGPRAAPGLWTKYCCLPPGS